MSEALSKIFDVAPNPITIITPDEKSLTIPPEGAEDEDHLYARAKHYEISEAGSEAISIAMRIVRETEDPKAVVALSTLLKNLAEVNKSLLSLNKDKSEAKAARGGKNVTPGTTVGTAVQNQTNILFAGSSSELNKLIAEQSKGK